MADEVQLTATRIYKVKDNSPVYLSIIIGNANVGSTVVYYKDEMIGGDTGQIDKLPVGNENELLKFNLLKCTTKVKDINPSTNKTFVTYLLEGGVKDEKYEFTIDVKQEGGYAVYSVTFVFV